MTNEMEERDTKERVIVIGDVHGCYTELMGLLGKLKWDPQWDRLIFAGDLIDRGPESAKVVEWVREHNKIYPSRVECVLGNHDDKHFRYFKHTLKKREHPNYKIPMRAFSMEKLQVFNSLSDPDLIWLGQLPPIIDLGNNWVVVHAGLEPGKDLWHQDAGKVSHIRFLNPENMKTVALDDNYQPPPGSVYWTEVYDGTENVIYGHNVHSLSQPEVTVRPNGATLVGIDTGACFGGKLTAFIVPERGEPVSDAHFVQVRAVKTYSRSIVHSN